MPEIYPGTIMETDSTIIWVIGFLSAVAGLVAMLWAFAASKAEAKMMTEARDKKIDKLLVESNYLVEFHKHAEESGIGTKGTNEMISGLIAQLSDEFRQMYAQQRESNAMSMSKFESAMLAVSLQLQVSNENQKLLIEALSTK